MTLISIILIAFIIIGVITAIYLEIKDYNKGICPKCGAPLRNFDCDSQGGRGYVCDKCNYSTWVSYWFVDKK